MQTDTANFDQDRLLHERDAADFLKLSVRTLQAWRREGFGPTFVRAGRAIRYTRVDLILWIESRRVQASMRPIAPMKERSPWP